MVNNAATLGRSGVHDFILLRASAVILALYSVFMLGWFLTTPEVTYEVWTGLFANLGMKIFTVLAVVAVLFHAWIGIWQVLTDYVKQVFLRGVLQFLFTITLFVYVAAVLLSVWGV
ncbi:MULTISPECIES: succinate dehydrogenase, hydrophobic membrane anchor protein [unclassified Thalassotalea]|uniref:succinate dehydrogenase, hydrophobic membrane anchor protein n=1 Tax=unclassified Thalassotalea TaxID=2614972 RepID=UPI00107FDBD0|nr:MULTISPECIES: succinate dehydrogenase, hydrophobic membrane anchor protein [unclassified Thalassotalea]NMP16711.1 succinate dehydrogenase, hydrophobic membrane anchor protein [Thalassotalea sp. Y01]QBY05625.1 succinate dehydrogenase, hydrophobic membrane anchor protein [Thalassotalea sp. HSM 43]